MAYQTPRGTYDILPTEVYRWHQMEDLIRNMCTVYDYKEIRTPIFEDTSVFKRENDSSDMVNKEMYTFQMSSDSLTLRPEGTAGVIRSFVQNKMFGSMEMPAKLYYIGPMFRHERPQKGRQRQFNQFGIENIGVKNPMADVETIALGYSLVKTIGLQSIKVLINTLGDDESRLAYKEALREHFKDHVEELCGDCKRRYDQNPLRLLDCKVDHDHPSMKNVPLLEDYLTEESKVYFKNVCEGLEALGIPYEVDQHLVRGLDYYTHTVFEVVSTHEEAGSQSTIFAGGRYDGLVNYFGGPEMSGVGFAIGLERLLLMAQAENCEFFEEEPTLDVYVMSLGNVGSVPLQVATMCRSAGFITDFNIQERSMKSQFKSVDRKQAKVCIIVGEDEVKNNQVNLKHIESQTQVTISIDEIIDTLDHYLNEEHECHCGHVEE
ncbi:MAG: histidine--tRNA ligase [Anaerorhabdus sp.]|uniref:histidine--tRNA ligase n=3 Tax=Anaerorhabdus sp. TaxID=1872524 RepID=UPI002B204F86|nr:histidine--tRNA ligase [Anaerorhabdus sp.]MEA4874171.1 histidine--tRNA ligase [Anaerorhabdus sp.]